jgi:hypothetical protein
MPTASDLLVNVAPGFKNMRWRLAVRKMTPAVLAMLVATLLIPTGPAHAQNYPWCAQRGDGGTNCGFVTYEQCMAKQGSWCYRNPMYQPSAGEPGSRRTPRESHPRMPTR